MITAAAPTGAIHQSTCLKLSAPPQATRVRAVATTSAPGATVRRTLRSALECALLTIVAVGPPLAGLTLCVQDLLA